MMSVGGGQKGTDIGSRYSNSTLFLIIQLNSDFIITKVYCIISHYSEQMFDILRRVMYYYAKHMFETKENTMDNDKELTFYWKRLGKQLSKLDKETIKKQLQNIMKIRRR